MLVSLQRETGSGRVPNDASFGKEARCDGAELDEVGSRWLAWCGSAIRRKGKIVVDLSVSTDRQLFERRPDLALHLNNEHRIKIHEGAVAWEPLLAEREGPKAAKCNTLTINLLLL